MKNAKYGQGLVYLLKMKDPNTIKFDIHPIPPSLQYHGNNPRDDKNTKEATF